MKPQLAMRLLAELMQWNTTTATKEFSWLRLMVEYKYDHYQGYSPGSRFFVSLLFWLNQFPTIELRTEAYKFIRTRLIFISQQEMHHLIRLSTPVMETSMRHAVADELGIRFHDTWTHDKAKHRLKLMFVRTLYVALSDGARIDVFRRDNDNVVSNEQVVSASEISKTKWQSLGKKLRNRLAENGYPDEQVMFERVCLIDDFTGSGSTLLRMDEGTKQYDGKVPRFCEPNRQNELLCSKCVIHVHHYLASAKAKQTLEDRLRGYQETMQGFVFTSSFSTVLREDVIIDDESDRSLVNLLTSCYDESIQTSHNCPDGKGIWFGYRQCGLPLVLEHNSPNNSIALIWGTSKEGSTAAHLVRPLFPRKDRHVDYGQSV